MVIAIVYVCEMKYDAVYEQCETKNLRSNKALSIPMEKNVVRLENGDEVE